MDQLTFNDLVLFLLSENKPRKHEGTLELFKALFERDYSRLTLLINILAALLTALIVACIGAFVTNPCIFTIEFVIFLITVVILLFALIFDKFKELSRLNIDYLDIIRLYYQLDKILP